MFVLVGPVGAGKSTWVKENADLLGGPEKFMVVSEDDARERFFASEADGTFKRQVLNMSPKAAYNAMWHFACDSDSKFRAFVTNEQKEAVSSGKTLVFDRTNWARKARGSMIALARQHGYKIVSVEFYVPLSVSMERQNTRADKAVPASTVKTMYYLFQLPWFGVEVDEVRTIM